MKLKTICFQIQQEMGKTRQWASFTGISRAKLYMHSSFALEFIVYILNNTFFF